MDVVKEIERAGIEWQVQAADWEDLTRKFGAVLVERGVATPEYTEAMIQNVHELGPYLVIAPGVALLHARPEGGALKNAVIVGTAEPKINFGHSSNDPVWLVLALTATGDMEHTALLREVAMLLAKPNALEQLETAKTKDEFVQILTQLDAE